MDVSAWLRSLGLEQYEQAFRENAIEPEILPKLTAEDLKELGISLVGHRRKLLDAIAALRGAAMEPTDEPEHGRTSSASPVDAIGERRQVTVLFADLSGSTALVSSSTRRSFMPCSSNSTIAPTASFRSTADTSTGTSATA